MFSSESTRQTTPINRRMGVRLRRGTWLWWIKNLNWKMESLNSDGDNTIQINFTHHQWIFHEIWDFSMDRKFWNFVHSRVMSYDSFFEKRVYESHMTHNICNIHIIWFQILFLIQWCKNFWDSPTQNFSIIFFSRMRGRNKILTSNSNSA